jgi:hypothetical protein
MRRSGPSAHPASTQLTVELRDQGLTWPEISRAGRYDGFRRVEPLPKGAAAQSSPLGRRQQVLADALDQNLAMAPKQPSLIISAEP